MSEYQYKSSNMVGGVTVSVETNDEDFMRWYLSHSDEKTVGIDVKIHCDEKYDPVDVCGRAFRCDEGVTKVWRAICNEETEYFVEQLDSGEIILNFAGYTFTGKV